MTAPPAVTPREKARRAFVSATGWAGADETPVAGDASTRSYVRLCLDGATAILMDAPPGPDGPPVADGLSYSALVHLAEDMRPFAALAGYLRGRGISAPAILARDLAQGFLLIEDLGDAVFGAEIDAGRLAEHDLYASAVDVLAQLHRDPAPGALPCGDDGPHHHVPAFDDRAMLTEASLLIDWYPRLGSVPHADDMARTAFFDAWRDVISAARAEDARLVLRDYHSPNLMWLPDREGLGRVGVSDFQDALAGPAAYDVASLLQDARRTVSRETEEALLTRYVETRTRDEAGFDASGFRAAYAVTGAQRNTKIIGIFARLCLRDGKPRYLAHIPRLAAYLARDLAHPALGPVAAWFAQHLPLESLARPVPPPGGSA